MTRVFLTFVLLSGLAVAEPIDTSQFSDSVNHWRGNHGRDREDPVFDAEDVRGIADNILQYQNADCGWPKNIDWLTDVPYADVVEIAQRSLHRSTFDNRNIYSQVEYLAKAFEQTDDKRYWDAVVRGYGYILDSQNASGGWRGSDVDAITFNDDVMSGIMNLLQDVREGAAHYTTLDDNLRARLSAALDRAIDVTLATQIEVDGVLTAWCQQHSHETLEAVDARSFELASISGAESVKVVRFLMRLENPDARVKNAIESAVAWFERSAIQGIRVKNVPIERIRERYHDITHDRVVVEDPDTPPLWARFYEIDTNRPFMCNRDGVPVYTLAEVSLERRTGYAWYGTWPRNLLEKDYPAWKAKHGGE